MAVGSSLCNPARNRQKSARLFCCRAMEADMSHWCKRNLSVQCLPCGLDYCVFRPLRDAPVSLFARARLDRAQRSMVVQSATLFVSTTSQGAAMVSADHFRRGLRAKMARATIAGQIDILINCGQLYRSLSWLCWLNTRHVILVRGHAG
jgi:hypothetical protein